MAVEPDGEPRPSVGRIALTPDAERTRQADRRFHAVPVSPRTVSFSSAPTRAETYYMRWFERHVPPAGVSRAAVRDGIHGTVDGRAALARPAAELGARRSRDGGLSLSCRSGAWTSAWCRATSGGCPSPATSGTRSGSPPIISARSTTLLIKAGRDYGLKLFGGRALNAMRIEKGFGTWAREFRPIYGPFEAGLGRFVDLKKGEFIGRAAAAEREREAAARCVCVFQGGGRRCRRDRR